MFTANKAIFLYAISPVHFGAGQAIGLIDNPIQREVHTGHPIFAGSGIKGAVRHQFYSTRDGQELERYFGKSSKGDLADFAGAVSFSDAQLVLFPVRANKSGYVYATSPIALARAKRLLEQAGLDTWQDIKESPKPNHALVATDSILTDQQLFVEAYELQAKSSNELTAIAEKLANYALSSDGQSFFKEKIKTDLVLMSDDDFGYFVKHAISVEPHVRINSETGVADGGGLFYTENLPPESVMIQMVMASNERSKSGSSSAEEVLDWVLNGDKGLNNKLLQVGGDATTGRGQVLVHVAGE